MPARQAGTGYRSPLLDLPGAVPATGADAGVAEHYGDPIREQREMVSGMVVFDSSHWPLIEVSGPDRLAWLDKLTTLPMADLPADRTITPLVLTQDGYVEHRLVITEFGGHAWVSPEPPMKQRMIEQLRAAPSGMRVEVDDVSSEWAPMAMSGPEVESVLTHLGVVDPPRPMSTVSMAGGGWLWKLTLEGGEIAPMVVPRGLVPQVVQRLQKVGVVLVGHGGWEAMRVAAHGPRVGYETDDHTLPQEVGWMGVMVDPGKTGYLGHEALARTLEAGPPPRRLVLLRWSPEPEELPPRGTAVEWEGRRVGFVGTAVRHFALGPIALALVDREVPDAATLCVGGAGARVVPAPADVRSGP